MIITHPKKWHASAKTKEERAEHQRVLQREWHSTNRIKAIQHYGGRCACCGIDDLVFLAIDHVHGGGTKHRQEVGDIYAWLRRNEYPEGFQVLCHNCNWAKSHGGCPHQKLAVAV